jgi:hypothetical protein
VKEISDIEDLEIVYVHTATDLISEAFLTKDVTKNSKNIQSKTMEDKNMYQQKISDGIRGADNRAESKVATTPNRKPIYSPIHVPVETETNAMILRSSL